MAIKKVVVAIGHGSRDVVVIKGNDLNVINKTGSEGELVIEEKQPKNTGEKTLGVFKVWSYWKAVQIDNEEQPTSNPSSIRKILVKPTRPMTTASWRNILKHVYGKESIGALPDHCSLIIIYKNGEVKII